ncbi:hypothetical protein EVJ58_g9313 [Rhodofomes roseus]|uniref:Ribonuclease H1 N-terminal domain-containing protein n=1 Tax=Rhodofomes roseus TaxID=34475 RepID=A0A4Y9XWF2_9APHY|nr:hypothetical protein EVJ58_g9313 [Rhodofomes roseus]
MAREGKNVDRSAPDGEQRFSLDQLQQLLEALRLVSEQEAERQMWRDVEDPSHPMTSDLPASGSGGNPPGAATVAQGGPSGHVLGAGAATVAQGGHSSRALGAGTVAQGGHSGCAGPADFAPPVRPPSPAPWVPSGHQGTSRVPAAPVIAGNGSGNTGVGLCGGCHCGNCGGHDRHAEDVGPGSSTGKLRWYSITKGKAIGVFCDWAIVGPLVLNVPGAMYSRYPTFSAALMSFMGAVDRGHVGIIGARRSHSDMGRRARYLTLADKREAKRSQQAKYRATDRGKATRRAQSRVEHPSRHGDTLPFPEQIEGIHAGIIAHARSPFQVLPDPSLDLPDPSLGLYTWPYELVIPPCYSTPFSEYDELFSDIQFVLDELKHAFNMQQYALLEDKGRERYALFRSTQSGGADSEVLLQRLDEELTQRLRSWEDRDTASNDMSMQAGVVRDVGIKWGARIICCLALELQLAKSGPSMYKQASLAKSLPWQRLYPSSD